MSAMATNVTTFSVNTDDPLSLLPRTSVRTYNKDEVIYRTGDRGEALYLVIEGRVKVSRVAKNGREVILEFCEKDDLFGEAGFSGSRGAEQATALDRTSLMMWPLPELERLMMRTPALGPALLRVVGKKIEAAYRRVESLNLDPINRRLAKAMLRLAGHRGQGTVHIAPTTHEQLAHYVGTSREIVTQYMNQFRRENLLQYSRQGIEVDVAAIEKYLAG